MVQGYYPKLANQMEGTWNMKLQTGVDKGSGGP